MLAQHGGSRRRQNAGSLEIRAEFPLGFDSGLCRPADSKGQGTPGACLMASHPQLVCNIN